MALAGNDWRGGKENEALLARWKSFGVSSVVNMLGGVPPAAEDAQPLLKGPQGDTGRSRKESGASSGMRRVGVLASGGLEGLRDNQPCPSIPSRG